MTVTISDVLRATMYSRFGGSVTRLAEACDVSVQLASKWVAETERKRITPGPKSCEKIAKALDLDLDYILELAGHRPARADQPAADPIQAELDTRLARLGGTLSKYPRAVWLAVLEANEKLAEALAHQSESPVSAPSEGVVSAQTVAPTRLSHGSDDTLAKRHPALPHRALALA